MIDPSLPLIDLHRHLEGSIRLETILDLGRKHNLPLPAWDPEGLHPYIQVVDPQPGVMEFIAKFEWMVGVLVDFDACRRVAYEVIEDVAREEIDYIEIRFSPWFMAEPHNLKPDGVVEAVVDGAETAAREHQIKMNLIGVLSRTYGLKTAWKELSALLRKRDHLVALDLAGDEANYSGEMFVDHMKEAYDAGLKITVHAGEAAGPESVWQAIKHLKADRIGHAVRAIEDAALMSYMLDNGIGIEANLTSNVQTSTVPDYASHPLRKFIEHGLLATINSDDPAISGISLADEYNKAAPAAGLTSEQIRTAQGNALKVAFLCDSEKQELLTAKELQQKQA